MDRVIKDDAPNAPRIAALVAGDMIDAVRQGGALRLLSGRVVQFRVSGVHQPQIGQTYVFFMTRLPAIAAFGIDTAYLVKDATVHALDADGRFRVVADRALDAFVLEIEAALGSQSLAEPALTAQPDPDLPPCP